MNTYAAALALLLVSFQAMGQGQAERGRKIYMEKWCHSCHGTAGQGGERGAGPRLAPDPFPYEAFAAQTRRPRQSMPRYPVEVLSEQEMADIYAYVTSIKARPAKDIPALRD
jgi:mono/diheme cytochrome c family protein